MRIGLLIVGASLLGGSAGAQVGIEVGPAEIRVAGLTTGGRAVLFGLGKGRAEGMPALLRCLRVAEVSGARGTETFPPCTFQGRVASPIPAYSAWVAVDTATGGMAAASPAGPMAVATTAAIAAAQPLQGGRFASLRLPGGSYELLLVRPGVGVWDATVVDGLTGDEDGETNGSVVLSAETMRRGSEGFPALDAFAAGDRVILMDRQYFAVSMGRVGGEP